MISNNGFLIDVRLHFNEKQLFITHTHAVHVLRVRLQHVIDVSAMESLVEWFLSFRLLILLIV